MKIKQSILPTGAFTVTLIGADGVIKEKREVKNVVVTAGKNYLAALLAESPPTSNFMSYVAIGSGATAATAGDTALQTELFRNLGTKSSALNVWQNSATFAAGEGTGTVAEAGILSAAVAGSLMARQTFGAIVKSPTDIMIVTWQITFA